MMWDMVFIIVISTVIITFIGMIGAITWSIFEDTKLGTYIVDKLTKREEE